MLCTGASGFIGTHLMNLLLKEDIEILNVDIKEPVLDIHHPYWQACDILDAEKLKQIFLDFQPTDVVHLAARTDIDSDDVTEYQINTKGTENVLEAIKATPTIQRVIVTSTQFVCRPENPPIHDEDYSPHTAYGESKVISEQMTRQANLDCVWTIIRPTNIWGPWHPRFPYEFWRVLSRGLYFHPGNQPVIRCYGYVANIVIQIQRMLQAPTELVDKKVYYVGDRPINILDYVQGFSMAITEQKAHIMPRSFVHALAIVGDALNAVGIKFPIYSSRFHSMTQDYWTPIEKTFEAFGEVPYSLDEGIQETTAWLKDEGFIR